MYKKIIKKILLSFGKEIVEYNKTAHRLEEVKLQWLKKYDIRTIIDVGAAIGTFINRLGDCFPQAKIYAFEPLPFHQQILEEKFGNNSKVKLFKTACSTQQEEFEININTNLGSSSILELGDAHLEAFPSGVETSKIKIKADRLDVLLKNEILEKNILLKIDVQGFELEVLKGAGTLLDDIKLVILEVSFKEMYKNQPLIDEVIDFMRQNNFRIIAVEDISKSLKDGSHLQADMFFEKIV